MGDHSAIEWTDATWNPTVGCDKVSAGCTHCYAITQAYRLEHGFKQPAYQGLTRKLPDGSVNWTGVVRTLPERLTVPLQWHKPARIFFDSMSDLFHEDVPDEFIDRVFAVMALTPWHTYQILTKRPARLLEYMTRLVQGPWAGRMFRDGQPDTDVHRRVRDAMVNTFSMCSADVLNRASHWQEERCPGGDGFMRQWPLPRVWLGTSVEDQRAADERIPLLLQTPAAVRFLSAEPLLGPIDLRYWLHYPPCPQHPGEVAAGWGHLECDCRPYQVKRGDGISWLIAGGESGPNYRPMDLDWARSLRDQCTSAGVAYFFKQIGGRTHASGGRLLDGRTWDQFPEPVREAASASR
jgi:protein gp37